MNLIPIRVNTLKPGQPLLFDVFVAVGERFIHYIRKSEPMESDRLSKLKAKGVKKLFVREEEENAYLRYLDEGLQGLKASSATPAEKGALVSDSLVTEAENIERNLDSEHRYHRVQERVRQIVDFLGSSTGALRQVLEAAGCASDDYQHCANVASLSVGLALKVGGIAAKDVFDLSLASLVHDIGKTKLGFTGHEPLETMEPKRKIQYLRHPDLAVELLASKPHVTPGLLKLVSLHEELGEGEGFPNKKNIESLPVTVQILSLCNHFDVTATQKKIPPLDLMNAFFQEKAHLFPLDLQTALGNLLQGK